MAETRVGPLTRERRRELTRTALIEAAADLFGRQGFHATSLEEIANAAGFTRGAIYKNFKSKEEIILAVVDWNMDLQLAAYADVLEDTSGVGAERATAAAEVWAHFFRRDRGFLLLELELRLHALRDPQFRPVLVEWERRHRDRIGKFIAEQARAIGLTLPIPANDFAAFTLAAMEGLSLGAALHSDDTDRYDRLVAFFFQMVSGVVTPGEKAPAGRRASTEERKSKRSK